MSVKNQAHPMFYAIFSRVYITVLTMEVETNCPDRQIFTRSGRSLQVTGSMSGKNFNET